MDTTLKQRILGIIVLVALLGICLSVLLHHNKNAQRSRVPAITKTTTTPPPIVNTTSALLNSNNSANMTPANTNVFDTDTPAPSNTATPNTAAATSATTTPTSQPQLQQQLQIPAQSTAATPQSPTQSSAAFDETSPQSPSQPVVNNQTSPSTVASSAIKPITPPSNTAPQDVTAQISAANTTPVSSANTDDAYTSSPNDSSYSSGTAVPTNTTNAITHKATPHSHAKVTKIAAVHKKTSAPIQQHTTVVNTTSHTAISNSQEAGTGFVVQVGSFNLPANAETLADKLRAKGFVTSVQKFHTAQGDMTRVVVGKNGLDHTQVETLRHQIQTEMQIQGFVVPQNTSNHATATSPTATHSNTTLSKHVSANAANTNVNDEI